MLEYKTQLLVRSGAEKYVEMPLQTADSDRLARLVKPLGQVLAVDEADLGSVFRHTEMYEPCVGESTFLHNTVGRNACPTRFDRETSYSLMENQA